MTVGRELEQEWHFVGASRVECYEKEENKFCLTLSVREKENKFCFGSAILATVRKMWPSLREETSLLAFLSAGILSIFPQAYVTASKL